MQRTCWECEQAMNPRDDGPVIAHALGIVCRKKFITTKRGNDRFIVAMLSQIMLGTGPQLPVAKHTPSRAATAS